MEFTTYTTIETDDSKYKLSALLINGEYKMTSLEIPKEIDNDNYWDNPDYLLNSLLPFLQKKKDKIKSDDKSYKLIPKDRRREIKKLIKEGVKLGFFKNLD